MAISVPVSFLGWILDRVSGGRAVSSRKHCLQFPACGHDVSSCLQLFPPGLPHRDGLHLETEPDFVLSKVLPGDLITATGREARTGSQVVLLQTQEVITVKGDTQQRGKMGKITKPAKFYNQNKKLNPLIRLNVKTGSPRYSQQE